MQGRTTRRTHCLGSASSGQPAGSNERLALEPLEERRMLAGTPELLADIGGSEFQGPSYGESGTAGRLFYFTSGTLTGEELWRSDGTEEGTFLVKDINPGTASSQPRDLTNVGGKLYFTADDGVHGRELWVSDGSSSGTHLVRDISDGQTSISMLSPVPIANSDDKLLFLANDGSHGNEPWISDGSTGGTFMLADLKPGAQGSSIRARLVGDTAYLLRWADDVTTLWTTDGTSEGTQPLTQIGASQQYVQQWSVVDGVHYYFMTAATVWRSDGTPGGTYSLTQTPAAYTIDFNSIAAFSDDLYFAATTATHGKELFKFDIGTSTFSIVDDILPGTGSSAPHALTVAGDSLYFLISNSQDGDIVWRTDGTAAGTGVMGNSPNGPQYRRASRLVNVNGTLLFTASDANYALIRQELWRSDGTDAGTMLVKDLRPGQGGLLITGYGATESDLFVVDRISPDGLSLFKSDGTEAGTGLVRVVHPSSEFDVVANDYLRVGHTSYVATQTGLWAVPDGGQATRLTGHRSRSLLEIDGRVYFEMTIDSYLQHIMTTDGTPEGTESIFYRGTNLYDPFYLTEFDGRLHFTNNYELWSSDGTSEGSILIKQVWSSSYPGPTLLKSVNGKLFFTAGERNGAVHRDLWVSDGTTGGTVKLESPGMSFPGELIDVGGALYFTATHSQYGEELWVSDGTLAGTRVVKDIRAGTQSSSPTNLTNVAGQLYFMARDGAAWSLCTSDGTDAGTRIVYTIANPSLNGESNRPELVGIGDTIYFTVDDGVHGDEIWFSQVGQSTAQLLVDLNASGSSNPSRLVNVNGVLYFTADSGNGTQLWKSNGTPAGTSPVLGWPGESGAKPDRLANVGGSLIFTAGGPTGRDPWIIRPPHVVSRHLLYNDSAFDGDSAAANAADDGAIAPDKSAYLPGSGRSTTVSVSSYVHGINGVMIDIAGLEGELSADDFVFRVGTNGSSPENWAFAPAPLEVVVRAGAGANGSDRVTITWANGAIKNTWLQVTVKGNDAAGGFNTNTGLAESDVFFFGSRVGDTFEGATTVSTATTSRDELAARFGIAAEQALTSLFDFNRDGVVSAIDQLIARQNVGVLRMLEIDGIAEVLVASRGASDTQAGLAFALALGDGEEADDAPPAEPWRRSGRRSK